MKGTGNREENILFCTLSIKVWNVWVNCLSNFSTFRLVWCWSWPLWALDRSSFCRCFPRKGCCGTVSVRLLSLQFCGVEIE
jgi:hypothetical protein